MLFPIPMGITKVSKREVSYGNLCSARGHFGAITSMKIACVSSTVETVLLLSDDSHLRRNVFLCSSQDTDSCIHQQS